jgi:hypothetical protein
MGPGDQVWEKFGHDAIWIHDAENGTDIAYHWGLFDFADKDFVPRFIQGRMRYSMGAFDFNQTLYSYRMANRTVWAQQLNFTPAQRQRLADFIAWNIRPENRYYHYDYFRDNCATRVRDALDAALGGVIRAQTERLPTATTYRFHTSRLTQDSWPVFTGTMMGLGEPTDRRINAWEEMFLPVRMMKNLHSVRVKTANGTAPLVISDRVLFQATRPAEDVAVRRGMGGYLLIAVVILAIGIGLWYLGKNGSGAAVLSLAALWSFVAGIAGTLLTGLWAFTDHLYSYRNENILQLNPLSLVVLVLMVRFIWQRRNGRSGGSGRSVFIAALVVAALSVAGFVMQAFPKFNQVNADVIALAMPLHLGVVILLAYVRSAKRTLATGNT